MNAVCGFSIRRFDPARDLDAAYRCYVESFRQNSWPIIDHAEPRLLKDLILLNVRIADEVIVAERDGEARGLLFGSFPTEGANLPRAAALLVAFSIRVFLHGYDMTAFSRAAYRRMALGQVLVLLRHVRTPAEITILISQKGYRGGIGRAMMDAWVAEVEARRYKKTTVFTDSTVSWDFYERYGFKRVREFPYHAFFYSLPGVDVTGYFYSLDIG